MLKIKITLNSCYCEIGFFNEADTLESSSILTYSHLRQKLVDTWYMVHGTWYMVHGTIYG
jgi:hypothetical protein